MIGTSCSQILGPLLIKLRIVLIYTAEMHAAVSKKYTIKTHRYIDFYMDRFYPSSPTSLYLNEIVDCVITAAGNWNWFEVCMHHHRAYRPVCFIKITGIYIELQRRNILFHM